jgi:hypothetical protein
VVKAIKWGLSPLDWRRHAVDERRDHLIGVYVAQCGQADNLALITAFMARASLADETRTLIVVGDWLDRR